LTQFSLFLALLAHEGRVRQGALLAVVDLEAVLQTEDGVEGDALLFLAGRRIFDQTAAQFGALDQGDRDLLVAQTLQLADGQQTRGRAGGCPPRR
jgi:hypothetical protein